MKMTKRIVKCLDDVQKTAIYNGFLTGATKTSLADQFGVSVRTIGRVIEQQVGTATRRKPKSVAKSNSKPMMIGSNTFITVVKDGETFNVDSSHPNFEKAK